jgi:hypothetical protein
LNDFFLNAIGAGFPFPEIQHFGKTTDNRAIGISILMFEAKKFT